MSVEFDRESPGKLESGTLSRITLSRRTGRIRVSAEVTFGQGALSTFPLAYFFPGGVAGFTSI